VLNDELYTNLEDEIRKYEGILNKPAKKIQAQEKATPTKAKQQTPKRQPKRRAKKEERKSSVSNSDVSEDPQSSVSSANIDEVKDEDYLNTEHMEYDSEYSCPEDPNTKLFAIERVIKKKPKRGKKRAKVATTPVQTKYGDRRKIKDNLAIQSIASTTNSSSPAKTLSQNVVSFKETSGNPSNHIDLKILKEDVKIESNIENG
jgi:hypothetical protein